MSSIFQLKLPILVILPPRTGIKLEPRDVFNISNNFSYLNDKKSWNHAMPPILMTFFPSTGIMLETRNISTISNHPIYPNEPFSKNWDRAGPTFCLCVLGLGL
jgi:hypothetical protein